MELIAGAISVGIFIHNNNNNSINNNLYSVIQLLFHSALQ